MCRRQLNSFWLLLGLLLPLTGVADVAVDGALKKIEQRVATIKGYLGSSPVDDKGIPAQYDEIKALGSELKKWEDRLDKEQKPLIENMEILKTSLTAPGNTGKAATESKANEVDNKSLGTTQSKEFQKQVKLLTEQLAGIEYNKSKIKIFKKDLEYLGEQLIALQQKLKRARLSKQGESVFAIYYHFNAHVSDWNKQFKEFTQKVSVASIYWEGVGIYFLVMGFGAAVGVLLRRIINKNLNRDQLKTLDFYRLDLLTTKYVKAMPTVFLTAALLTITAFMTSVLPAPWLYTTIVCMLIYFAALPLLQTLVFGFCGPNVDAANQKRLRALERNLNVLLRILIAIFIGREILEVIGIDQAARRLYRDIGTFLAIYYSLIVIWRMSAIIQSAYSTLVKFFSTFILLLALLLEMSGYRVLTRYMLQWFLGTMLLVAAFKFFNAIIHDLARALLDPNPSLRWQKAFNSVFRDKDRSAESTVFWIRISLQLALWGGLVFGLLHLYGLYYLASGQIYTIFFDGFKFGTFQISPYLILLGILVFSIISIFTRWVKKNLDERWLRDSPIDRGARDAIVTLSGYVGISIAVVMGLGIVGVSFTNLAIIAGALSVGIGFGLQNIISNFVSGLILLFERPIRPGDWVVVGNVEGYVKKISIRATILQTFDNADVIVPNSEFITTKVTNWMYYDKRGRIKVPIGVAYGSDTTKLIEVLDGIARAHPEVVTQDPKFPIRVLFMNFGDSALNFELRCFIRSIDKRLSVISEINIAINAEFSKLGVSIPFPQREIVIRNPGDLGHL